MLRATLAFKLGHIEVFGQVTENTILAIEKLGCRAFALVCGFVEIPPDCTFLALLSSQIEVSICGTTSTY